MNREQSDAELFERGLTSRSSGPPLAAAYLQR